MFDLFDVDLNNIQQLINSNTSALNITAPVYGQDQLIPGPPFLFGAFFVLLAILVAAFIPELIKSPPDVNDSFSSSNFSSVANRLGTPARSYKSSGYYYKNINHLSQSEDTHCNELDFDDTNDVNVKFLSSLPSSSHVDANQTRRSVSFQGGTIKDGSSGDEDEQFLLVDSALSRTNQKMVTRSPSIQHRQQATSAIISFSSSTNQTTHSLLQPVQS